MSNYLDDITEDALFEYSKEIVRSNFENLMSTVLKYKKYKYEKSCFGEFRDKEGCICSTGAIGVCEYSEECKRCCRNY